MYLRVTQRRNRDGSTVTYYALAEAVWNAEAKRREARVIHSFGRADQLDRAALERLVRSINRVLGDDEQVGDGAPAGTAPPDIEIDAAFEFGIPLAARHLWEELGIGPAVRDCLSKAELTPRMRQRCSRWRRTGSMIQARSVCQRRIKTRPAWRRKNRPLDCDVTDMRTAPAGAVLISAACLAVGISCR